MGARSKISKLSDDEKVKDAVARLSAPRAAGGINFETAEIEGRLQAAVEVGVLAAGRTAELLQCFGSKLVLGALATPASVEVLAKVDCQFSLWATDDTGASHLVSSMRMEAGNGYSISVKGRRA